MLSLGPAGEARPYQRGGEGIGSGLYQEEAGGGCHKDGMGPGGVSAAGRRRKAVEQERLWVRERRADALAAKHGFNSLRRGFAKLD